MEVFEARLRDCEENLQLFYALLSNPRIFTVFTFQNIIDSEPNSPLPFTVQRSDPNSIITFTQSGLCRRNRMFWNAGGNELFVVERVAVGYLTVSNNTIIEFTPDK
eukprot:gene615-667_t